MSDNLWNDVRRLADELELKIHLARMDARDRWADLKPKLIELEHTAEDQAKHQLGALAAALKQLRDEVFDELEPPRPR